MKLFQSLQTYFSVLGIRSSQSEYKNPFNKRNSLILIRLVSVLMLAIAFVFYEAKTFEEITDSLSGTISLLVFILNFSILILNAEKIFDYIENFEITIEKSE